MCHKGKKTINLFYKHFLIFLHFYKHSTGYYFHTFESDEFRAKFLSTQEILDKHMFHLFYLSRNFDQGAFDISAHKEYLRVEMTETNEKDELQAEMIKLQI